MTPEAIATRTNVITISPNTVQPWPRTISRERPNDSPADLPSMTMTATTIDQIVSRKSPGTTRSRRPIPIARPAMIPAAIRAGSRGGAAVSSRRVGKRRDEIEHGVDDQRGQEEAAEVSPVERPGLAQNVPDLHAPTLT